MSDLDIGERRAISESKIALARSHSDIALRYLSDLTLYRRAMSDLDIGERRAISESKIALARSHSDIALRYLSDLTLYRKAMSDLDIGERRAISESKIALRHRSPISRSDLTLLVPRVISDIRE
jgi:type II secretory ATPase GspE/PulE/Tfp pilus assembly ATPase PilB-like protein